MSNTNNESFSTWMEQRKHKNDNDNGSGSNNEDDDNWNNSLTNWKTNIASQLHTYSNILPDASTGPLSAEYRQRVEYVIYMLLLGGLFGGLAIFVGLPTIVIRPSKFVICSTLCSLCVASSIIILKKPSVFLAEIWCAILELFNCNNNNTETGSTGSGMTVFPLVFLMITNILTIYITVFYHNYLYTILASCLQCLSIIYYLLSYIPGGTRSLSMLSSSIYYLVLKPLIAAGWNCGYYCTTWSYSLIFPSETPTERSWF